MDVLPAWAEALFREKLGASPLTRVEVLKDTPFHKILVGYTATSAVLAEKGLLGRNAYLLPAALTNPPSARPPTASTEEETVREVRAAKKQVRPKPRRAPPAPKDPPPKAKVNRGKVAPRRKPAAKGPPTATPATEPVESPGAPSPMPEPEPAPPRVRPAAPAAEVAPPKGRPIELVDGIGPSFRDALRAHGVRTAEDLIRADAATLAAEADLTPELVAKWQAMATLQQVDVIGPQSSELLVRAGLRDLRSLAQETPESLAKRLGDYESGPGVRVQNLTITPELCAGWIQGARETLERTRGT